MDNYFEIIIKVTEAIKKAYETLKELEKSNMKDTLEYQKVIDDLIVFKSIEQDYYNKLDTDYMRKKLDEYELIVNINTTNIDFAILETMGADIIRTTSLNRRVFNKMFIEYLKRNDSNLLDITIPNPYDFPTTDTDGSITINGYKIYVYDRINWIELIRNNMFLNIDAKYLILLDSNKENIETKYNLLFLNSRLEELLLKTNFVIKNYLPEQIDNLETRATNKVIYNFFKQNYNRLFFEDVFDELISYDDNDFSGKNKKISTISFKQTLLYMLACSKSVDEDTIESKIYYLEEYNDENKKVYNKIKEKLTN